jgi:hypothetical protein
LKIIIKLLRSQSVTFSLHQSSAAALLFVMKRALFNGGKVNWPAAFARIYIKVACLPGSTLSAALGAGEN